MTLLWPSLLISIPFICGKCPDWPFFICSVYRAFKAIIRMRETKKGFHFAWRLIIHFASPFSTDWQVRHLILIAECDGGLFSVCLWRILKNKNPERGITSISKAFEGQFNLHLIHYVYVCTTAFSSCLHWCRIIHESVSWGIQYSDRHAQYSRHVLSRFLFLYFH